MKRPVLTLLVVAATGFCVGAVVGGSWARTPSEDDGVASDATQHADQSAELAAARDTIAERDRTIARLRRDASARVADRPTSPESMPQPPSEAIGPQPASAAATEREMLEDLPGAPAGVAARSATEGDRDWTWFSGTILPDRGSRSGGAISPSVRIDAEHGALSVVLPPNAPVKSDGLVAIRFGGQSTMQVVYRTQGSDGLRETGGPSASLRRARDLADAWQTVAKSSRTTVDVPSVIGCSTLRFQVNDVAYTLVTCVEYGPDGKPLTVTVRDGR